MGNDLSLAEAQLETYMSNLSEECYAAGWMSGLEYVLWHAVVQGERQYGRGVITEADVAMLRQLSDDCKGWVYFDEEKEETAIPMDLWLKKYEEVVTAHPAVIRP